MNEKPNLYEPMKDSYNPKASKGKGKTLAIVVLVILLLGSVGYTVYDKFIKEDVKETEVKKDEPKKEESKQVYTDDNMQIANKTIIQSLEAHYVSAIVDKNGDVYIRVKSMEGDDEETNNSIKKIQAQHKEYNLPGYRSEASSCSNGKSNVLNGIKLSVTDVVAAYEVYLGQSIDGYYIGFVKSDGTVSALKVTDLIYENKITIIDNVDNLKNIVSIAKSSTAGGCSEAFSTIAIEKNGTQHNIVLD